MTLHASNETHGDLAIVRLSGGLTFDSHFDIRAKVLELAKAGAKTIMLDLSDVTVVDSTGIGQLISAFTGATNANVKFTLSGLPKALNDLLKVTNLQSVFTIDSDTDASKRALAHKD